MKHVAYTVLLVVLVGLVRADDFQIGPRWTIKLNVAQSWKAESKRLPGRGMDITLEPRGEANALCHISVRKSLGNRRHTEESVEKAMQLAGEKLLSNAVETNVVLKEFEVEQGYGVYSSYTDKTLIDEEPVKGTFKMVTTGMVLLNEHYAANITIYADSPDSVQFQDMLAMVNSLELRRPER